MDQRQFSPSPRRLRPRIARVAIALGFLGTANAPIVCAAESSSGSITGLVARIVPSVTAIHTRRVIPPSGGDSAKAGQAPKIERAEGSGFIVSGDGFIATNKHVVDGAYDITVILSDGEALQATVVYESPVIDVAFIRVHADHPLPAAVLARGDALKLGQRVVAIGNPQGLGISVSAGIVSALDRNLKQSPYDRYIQTDAAINPGNSGGPLFDLSGEVVGMDSISWVAGENAGSDGLGFAIPGSSIAFLIDQLRQDGHIRCGTLGVKGQKLTATMRNALSFPGNNGVIIAAIDKNSVADQAGLRLGDVIQSFNGDKLYDITALNHAACFALGQSVSMEVWRDGKSLPMQLVMTKVEDVTGGKASHPMVAPPRFASASDLGMTLAPIDDQTRQRYKLGADVAGFVVTAVSPSSEADAVGLSPGDVIKSLQMTPLSKSSSFDEAFARYGTTGRRYVLALVGMKSGDRWVTLPVRLESMQAR